MKSWRSGRLLVVAAVTVGSVLLTVVSVSAAPSLVLDPPQAAPGQTVVATGSEFPANEEVVLHLDEPDGPVLAKTTTDRGGDFEVRFTVPRIAPGEYQVVACYQTSRSASPVCPADATLTVLGPSPSPPTSPTPSPSPSPSPAIRPTSPSPSPTGPQSEDAVAPTASPSPGIDDFVGPSPTEAGLQLTGGDQPDLHITGLEITQGIQDLDNEMPLVAGRITVVRVYVKTLLEDLAGVTGALQVTPPGKSPTVVLPSNGPVVATTSGSDRNIADETLNFLLPPETTTPTGQGSTKLLAYIYSGHPNSPEELEPQSFNNFKTGFVEFHAVPALAIRTFPIHLHAPAVVGPDVTFGGTLADLFTGGEVFVAAYRYLPTHELIPLPGATLYPPAHFLPLPWLPPFLREWDLSQDGQESQVNSVLLDYWEQTTPEDEFEQFYGMMAPDHPAAWGGLSNGTVAHGNMSVSKSPDWYHFTGGKTMAHELAHNVGFKHNLCKGNEPSGGAVEPYPYSGPPCSLATTDPGGWYGFDVVWQSLAYLDGPAVISNNPSPATLNKGFPVMGYLNPRWADPYYWCRQLEHFGVNCTALTIPENQPPDPDEGPPEGADTYEPASGQDGWYRTEAWISLQTAEAMLLDTRRVAAPPPRVLSEYRRRRSIGTPTEYSVALFDAGGQVIGEPTTLVSVQAVDELAVGSAITADVVNDYSKWMGDPAAIRVIHDGQVVAEREVSASPPTIDVVAPAGGTLAAPIEVRWNASDPDGDALAFSVSYSPDEGESWTMLARYLAGDSYVLDSFDLVGGGDRVVFRVEATDGVHTAFDESEPAVAPDIGPILSIVSPGEGLVVGLNVPLMLRATAWDWEDGADRRPQVRWSSDRDGVLASGGSAVTEDLSAGEHVITASATDSQGNTTDSSVRITVDPNRRLVRPTADELAALNTLLSRGPEGGLPWIQLSVVAGVLLIGLVSVLAVRRRRHRPDASAASKTDL